MSKGILVLFSCSLLALITSTAQATQLEVSGIGSGQCGGAPLSNVPWSFTLDLSDPTPSYSRNTFDGDDYYEETLSSWGAAMMWQVGDQAFGPFPWQSTNLSLVHTYAYGGDSGSLSLDWQAESSDYNLYFASVDVYLQPSPQGDYATGDLESADLPGYGGYMYFTDYYGDCSITGQATQIVTINATLDSDGDGIDDSQDACPNADATGWDLDGDGCLDDSDGDGLTDDLDTCPGGDDIIDVDGDGAPDFCDICPDDPDNDQDGDGLCASDDLCPLDYTDDLGSDDLDGDTVCNSADVCADGDDLYDNDEDGLADDCELCPNDAANDADGDGVCGDVDVCYGDDTLDNDADGVPNDCDTLCPNDPTNDGDLDGVCGESDPCPFDTLDDSDGDGACDSEDLCPGADDYADDDGDGVVDCVDSCPEDPENDGDGDGLCESVDNCWGVENTDQADADGDGVGNACEPDSDADGLIDDEDNCAYVANASQADADLDGAGDVCDEDDDNDGVADAADRCAATAAGAPALSSTGCSLAQTCSPTASWKNHGAYVSCVSNTAGALQSQGAITSAQKDALVSAAAQSNIGRR